MSNNEQRDDLPIHVDAGTSGPNLPMSVLDPDICHTVMESMPDGIILVDRARRIVAANIATEDLFGYSRNELISQSVDMLVPVANRQRHIEQSAEFFANPVMRSMGTRDVGALRKDGSEFTVSIKLGPIHSGDQVLACAVIRDVSQRKYVERALHDAEAQVRLLLNSTEEAIFGLDMNGNATFCNRSCVETLGYKRPEDLLGKNMHDMILHTRRDGSEYPVEECKIYQSFRVGVGTHVEDEVFWKSDGSSFPAEYRSFPIHRNGHLVGSVVTFLDITERKRVQDELRKKQSELTHVARLSMLGEMAAGLAHELNQPLTAMSALAEGARLRLERNKLPQTEFVSVCKRIAEDAQRAGDIIRRLRNFVQKRKTEYRQVCVNQLMRESVTFLESDMKHENITIRCKTQDGLWEVEADPIEIQQVVVNLVRNASDALAESDCPRREIVIETRNTDSSDVEIVVSDSGPGIMQELADQVFEPFYTSKSDGLGIGLGICKSIVETHGGRIWVGQSSMGGASVHFVLPAQMQQYETYAHGI
jgi:two-component system sensor histidine kinase TtrS